MMRTRWVGHEEVVSLRPLRRSRMLYAMATTARLERLVPTERTELIRRERSSWGVGDRVRLGSSYQSGRRGATRRWCLPTSSTSS